MAESGHLTWYSPPESGVRWTGRSSRRCPGPESASAAPPPERQRQRQRQRVGKRGRVTERERERERGREREREGEIVTGENTEEEEVTGGK